MLANKLPDGSAHPPYNLAAAATDMVWTCALATVRTAVASTARGLALWSQMLRTPVGPPPWSVLGGPLPDAQRREPEAAAATPEAAGTGVAPPEASAFASYRSAGGHASAQVIGPH
jgi:hypothetical protein